MTFSRASWTVAALLLLVVQAGSVARSAAQTMAITTVGAGARAGWIAAAAWDPGSYRINMRVAELQARSGRCNSARVYARRALAQFPYAPAPRRVLRECR